MELEDGALFDPALKVHGHAAVLLGAARGRAGQPAVETFLLLRQADLLDDLRRIKPIEPLLVTPDLAGVGSEQHAEVVDTLPGADPEQLPGLQGVRNVASVTEATLAFSVGCRNKGGCFFVDVFIVAF